MIADVALGAPRLQWVRRLAHRLRIWGRMIKTVIDGVAIPTLPMCDMRETQAFYEQLGFHTAGWRMDPEQYLILRRDELELHFFALPGLDPLENMARCYLRVDDVERLHEEFREHGLEGLGCPEDKPWGMREFELVDPSGNCVRVGQPVST